MLVIIFSIVMAKLMNILNKKIYTIYNKCSVKAILIRKNERKE